MRERERQGMCISGGGGWLAGCCSRLLLLLFLSNTHTHTKVIFFDSPFLPLVKALAPQLGDGVKWVCMVDEGRMPGKEEAGGVVPSGLLNYETLVKGAWRGLVLRIRVLSGWLSD